MINRTPAPGSDVPSCCGSGPQENHLCAPCAFQGLCLDACKKLADYQSLSQWLHSLFAHESESFRSMFVRLYAEHFGHEPDTWFHQDPEWGKVLKQVAFMCHGKRVDPEVYLSAQFHGLLQGDRVRKIGLKPSMLLGDNAKRRYNIYIHVSRRRYHRTEADAFFARTRAGKLCRAFYDDEVEVALCYVRGVLVDGKIEDGQWEEALTLCQCSPAWCEVSACSDLPGWDGEYSPRVRKLCYVRAKAAASVAVANSLRFGFADQVGFMGEFSWTKFAALALRLFGRTESRERAHVDAPGIGWGC